jgi:hypothetical protein
LRCGKSEVTPPSLLRRGDWLNFAILSVAENLRIFALDGTKFDD